MAEPDMILDKSLVQNEKDRAIQEAARAEQLYTGQLVNCPSCKGKGCKKDEVCYNCYGTGVRAKKV
jgi:DnaJ-class molecular chaperone